MHLYGVYPVGSTYRERTSTSQDSSEVAKGEKMVQVLTGKAMEFDCDAMQNDIIKVTATEGTCFVDTTVSKAFAINPCTKDTIWGVPERSDNKELSASFATGITTITWTFRDTTPTLLDSVKICTQTVEVEDINKLPINCENIPDTTIVLANDKCEINWTEIKLDVS